MNFSFLPAEVKFYDYFDKATTNLIDGARLLRDLLDKYEDVKTRQAQITEVEHRGDFIVHEVINLLPRTLITPIDSEDIQRLISAIDDALDALDAASERLVIYQVTEVKDVARRLANLILLSAQELESAVKLLRNKKHYDQIHKHVVQINTYENDADRILIQGLTDLVEHRDDAFDFLRWKEIYELLEDTTDRIEDAADVIQKVMIANA